MGYWAWLRLSSTRVGGMQSFLGRSKGLSPGCCRSYEKGVQSVGRIICYWLIFSPTTYNALHPTPYTPHP
ncbi:MAG: hypothetical protein F6J93_09870 [Oscillatoria sp. SIO1A7]|nr:hypothetical protein [Oscillatoria sp. SIO1A7]